MNGIWKLLFSCVLTALLTAISGYWLYLKQIEVPKLDVHTRYDSNYFSKPKFPDDQIKLIVNDSEKEKIGLLSVSLVNYSTKDLSDLSFTISLKLQQKNNFKVLAYSAVGQNDTPDKVDEIKKMIFDGDTYRFNYKASSINRVDEPDYGFQLRVLYEGEGEPQIQVSADGISTREYSDSHNRSKNQDSLKVTFLGVGLALVILIAAVAVVSLFIAPIISLLTHKWDVRFRQKRATDVYNVIKTNSLLPSLSDQQLKEHVADLLYQERLHYWDSQSMLSRWTQAMIRPERSEHIPTV